MNSKVCENKKHLTWVINEHNFLITTLWNNTKNSLEIEQCQLESKFKQEKTWQLNTSQ